MPKTRKKKRSPKRVLALPDLEESKAAVLNSLTSKSGQRTYDRAITDFVDWYCSEPRLALIAPSSSDTGSISNRSSTLRRRSICAWRPFGGSRTRPPIPDCSVRSLPPGSDALKEYAGLECVSGTGSPPSRANGFGRVWTAIHYVAKGTTKSSPG